MKSVLVTGCSSGIGRCIADSLKARNFQVITTARKQEDIDRLQQAGFDTVMLDLADSGSIRNAVEHVLEKTNQQLYGLVNNAAYGLTGAVEDISRQDLRDQFETNVFGTQELTNLIIPTMRKQNEGRIVQISSVLGFVTLKFRGPYCASKYALESLSDAMRLELQDTNIRISLVEPGPIRSEFRNNALNSFMASIDKENSVFRDDYIKMEDKLKNSDARVPFTLGPEAVRDKVMHALESRNPKDRYHVTVPTYLFAYLKRFLPGKLMDKILVRI